jgi:lipid-A-disaccharide synthase
MKYYIIAGEASGDLHASNLMKAITLQDPKAEFRCWGGDRMQDAGGVIVKHIKELAFMGFSEVILNLRTIMKNLSFCKKDILSWQPDTVILVDYPGFNLRIAEFAHNAGLKVIYYISPQIWAWKKSRVYKIRRYVDKMLVILPFEKEFYKNYNFDVEFVGHPLLDVTETPSAYAGREEFIAKNKLSDKPLIAVLPGSRKQEISRMLPVMAGLAGRFPDYEFVIAGAPSIDRELYQKLAGHHDLPVLRDRTRELLRYSHAALVTSGTATLETALYRVPQVVCYKGSTVSYLIARQLVDVKFISLVNLIMDRQVVKELIQWDFNEENLYHELEMILNKTWRENVLSDYNELYGRLGGQGASERAAASICKFLK